MKLKFQILLWLLFFGPLLPVASPDEGNDKVTIVIVPEGDAKSYGLAKQLATPENIFPVTTPKQFFDTLLKLKDRGKSVGRLYVTGHGQLGTPNIEFSKNKASDWPEDGCLWPKDVNLARFREQLATYESGHMEGMDFNGRDSASGREIIQKLRARIKYLEQVSEAMDKNAEVLLVNCGAAGTPDGVEFVKNLGEVLMGKNGGIIIASKTNVGVAEDGVATRFIGVCVSALSWFNRTMHSAGDYFIQGDFVGFKILPRPAGSVQIAVKRMKKNPWNGIEVTSEAMAMLDPAKPNQGLKFSVYRSEGGGKPLEIFNKHFVHYVFPDTPVYEPKAQDDEPVRSSRMARNKFLILDHISVIHDSERLHHMPYCYQVGQVAVTGREDIRETGKEIQSNVTEPGTEAKIRVLAGRSNDEWYTFGAALSLMDQQFDAWNTHFTVSAGSWKGHFFSGRKEKARNYGGVSAYSAPASLRVPAGPLGASVSITAEGDGLAASTLIEIPPNQERIALLLKQVEDNKRDLENALKRKEEDIARLSSAVEEMKWILNRKPADMSDYAAVNAWAESMRMYDGRNNSLRERKEYEYPSLENMYQNNIARALQEWPRVIRGIARDIELAQLQHEIRMAFFSSRETLNNALAACSNIPESGAKRIESVKREISQQREFTERAYPKGVAGFYDSMARAAILAGDIGIYEKARAEQIKLMSKPEDKRDLGSLYRVMADESVILTGDRTKGAAMLDRAMELEIEVQPDRAKEITQRYQDRRPAWWPAEK